MTYKNTVLLEKNNHIGVITLNRPEKLNALNIELMLELKAALIDVKKDEAIRVILLKGNGESFCAGADIHEFKDTIDNSFLATRERANTTMEVHLLIPNIPKPVISCVHGYALAGGCGIALASDLVIASEDAIFGYPEVKRGFVAALVMVNLTRLVGRRNAFELLITGRKVNAMEAKNIGMINEVVSKESLESYTYDLAKELSLLSSEAISMTKDLFYRVLETEYSKALESARDVSTIMRKTSSFAKGVSEFKKD